MGFPVQVYKREMPEGTLGVDPEVRHLKKYEAHMNGRCFAAGMETIMEVVDEIADTFRNRCDSSEVIISSPEPQDPKLTSLAGHKRMEFAKRAPLFSYEPGFLPN